MKYFEKKCVSGFSHSGMPDIHLEYYVCVYSLIVASASDSIYSANFSKLLQLCCGSLFGHGD